MEQFNPKETDISLAIQELISGPLELDSSIEEIKEQIEYLKNFLADYHEKVVTDKETYKIIESVSKRISELESQLTIVDILKRHPSLA